MSSAPGRRESVRAGSAESSSEGRGRPGCSSGRAIRPTPRNPVPTFPRPRRGRACRRGARDWSLGSSEAACPQTPRRRRSRAFVARKRHRRTPRRSRTPTSPGHRRCRFRPRIVPPDGKPGRPRSKAGRLGPARTVRHRNRCTRVPVRQSGTHRMSGCRDDRRRRRCRGSCSYASPDRCATPARHRRLPGPFRTRPRRTRRRATLSRSPDPRCRRQQRQPDCPGRSRIHSVRIGEMCASSWRRGTGPYSARRSSQAGRQAAARAARGVRVRAVAA